MAVLVFGFPFLQGDVFHSLRLLKNQIHVKVNNGTASTEQFRDGHPSAAATLN